ncbi:MAG: ADP-glyceromanno-heptose 6-epimerase [Alphaproteobacteria bacterium]|nr:ADP-glyceromanno-heptose 6-epimerase [Alphaproteobacteria bacterium]
MIIVTGGAGFIGSNIAARLAADGRDVVVVDSFGDSSLGKWRNLRDVDVADIVSPENLFAFLEKAWRDIDGIVHMGAISSTTETDVDLVVETNFRLSRDLWDWCVAWQRPLIYASSAATYGDGALGFVDSNDREDLRALKPLNAYGWSKKAFDLYAARRAAEGAAPPRWSGLKFFNVYGPNEGHKGAQKSVVAHMYPIAARGEAVRLFKSHHPDYADGGQLRDFICVRDCVDVVSWLLDEDIQGGVLNVGTGKARTFADLAGALFAALGAKPAITYVDTPIEIRDKYQYFTQADTTRLRALGYERQFTTIEAGVADYVRSDLARVE